MSITIHFYRNLTGGGGSPKGQNGTLDTSFSVSEIVYVYVGKPQTNQGEKYSVSAI